MIGALSVGITGAAGVFAAASQLMSKMGGAKNVADRVKDEYKTISGTRSLTDLVEMSRVEPEVIVDNDCANWEYLNETMQTLHSVFTGYYLQAATIFGSVNSVKVMNTLEKLNPNRKGDFFLNKSRESFDDGIAMPDGSWKLSNEAYKWSLPFDFDTGSKVGYSLEAFNATPFTANGKPTPANNKPKVLELLSNDAIKTTQEASTLSIGKLINVSFSDNDNDSKVVIPISIRLMVQYASSETVKNILSQYNFDNTAGERWHAWREGRISFIKDLILCQDMIDEKKRMMIKDKDGVFTNLVARMNNHKTTGLSGTPSMAASSTIVVISTNTLEDLEYKLGGKIENNRIRTKIFESGYMMILAVVDKQFDMVTFYNRGVATGTTMSVRDMKISSKGSGPDILDILKALGQGSAPQL